MRLTLFLKRPMLYSWTAKLDNDYANEFELTSAIDNLEDFIENYLEGTNYHRENITLQFFSIEINSQTLVALNTREEAQREVE